MRVPRIIAAGVLVMVPAALVTLSVHRDKRLSTGFERISVGMSQGEVFELMGGPHVAAETATADLLHLIGLMDVLKRTCTLCHLLRWTRNTGSSTSTDTSASSRKGLCNPRNSG
jgi:hypothetical protein